MTPTARSLQYIRGMGFTAQVVERFNPFAKVRQDLFGCIDLIACIPAVGILGIQACAGASHAARRAKAIAEPRLRDWMRCGGKFEVWSWTKRGPRGKRKAWSLRRDVVCIDELAEVAGPSVDGYAAAVAAATEVP